MHELINAASNTHFVIADLRLTDNPHLTTRGDRYRWYIGSGWN